MGQIGQCARGVDVDKGELARKPLCRQVVSQDFGLSMGVGLFGMFGRSGKHQHMLGREKGCQVMLVHGMPRLFKPANIRVYTYPVLSMCLQFKPQHMTGACQSAPISTLTCAATLRASGLMT